MEGEGGRERDGGGGREGEGGGERSGMVEDEGERKEKRGPNLYTTRPTILYLQHCHFSNSC